MRTLRRMAHVALRSGALGPHLGGGRCPRGGAAATSVLLPCARPADSHAASPAAPSAPWPAPGAHQQQPGQWRTLASAATAPAAPRAAGGAAAPPPRAEEDDGLTFLYEHPNKKLSFRTWRQRRALALEASGRNVQAKVDVLLEGQPLRTTMNSKKLQAFLQEVGTDAGQVVQQALALKAQRQPGYKPPRLAVLSLVACDDARMSVLNAQHRGKEGPTDVLSFEMDDGLDYKVRLPVKLLGDMVVSLDTALRQARERGHSLRDEVRILLVHGMLHLCGYDHELGPEQHDEMARAEQHVMAQLGWQGQGLIHSATSSSDSDPAQPSSSSSSATATALHSAPPSKPARGGGGFGAKPSPAPPPAHEQNSRIRALAARAAAPSQQQQQQQQQEGEGGRGFRRTPRRAFSAASAAAAEGVPPPGDGGGATLGVLGAVFGATDDEGGLPDEDAPDQAAAVVPERPQGGGGGGAGARAARSAAAAALPSGGGRRVGGRLGLPAPGRLPCLPTCGAAAAVWGGGQRNVTARAAPRDDGCFATGGAALRAPSWRPISAPSPAQARCRSVVARDSAGAAQAATQAAAAAGRGRAGRGDIRLVALDMDGTLLDASSRIRPSAAAAVRAACGAGVRVILATGKARPAALAACREAGLAGPGLLVHPQGPGIFLQGLAVHGRDGRQLTDAQLPRAVVEQCFRYVQQRHPDGAVSLVAFLGDHCSTLQMTDDVQELHHRYYEPLAEVQPSLERLLQGPPVKKLLFMTRPQVVDGVLKPHWTSALEGSGASILQAVPNMLEIVPQGVDKWAGVQVLLKHLDLTPAQFMAVGDGGNDLEMVRNAGVGVAMGNAVEPVKRAAAVVVASHDEDGIAQAFERFVL